MTACLLCRQERCAELINFGPQAICHHFLDGSDSEAAHPLILGECGNCGLVQLLDRIAPSDLVPRFDWLVYTEPEHHLDQLVALLRHLPGLSPATNICGLSHKDESTLQRFRDHGFARAWRVDRAADLGITNPREGIETIQQRIEPKLAAGLHSKYGAPDLVIARHILEHTHDTVAFMETLHRLVNSTGYVVIEVPDCARQFDLLDYTTLWEDHTLYFDETTLRGCVEAAGFSVLQVHSYPDPYEVVMVAIAIPRAKPEGAFQFSGNLQRARQAVRRFAQSFGERRQAVRQLLSDWRQDGKVALFGAGHRAATFINLMELGDLVEFVIDDHPQKRGKRMPGSHLPIVGSENLSREDLKFCLSSLASGSEKKVVQKNLGFVQRGGTFASIYPTLMEEALTFLAGERKMVNRV
jgi:hypothetical protein